MLGGGLPMGYSLLVVGPSGSGKTILATEFLAAGARAGEPGVIAAFEKTPSQLVVPRPEVKHLATRVPSAAGCSTRILSPDRLLSSKKRWPTMALRLSPYPAIGGFSLALRSPWLVDCQGGDRHG